MVIKVQRLLSIFLLAACTLNAAQCRELAAAGSSKVSDTKASSNNALTQVQQSLLNRMNHYRSQHGAAPLQWSKKLQGTANNWAKKCVFQHSGWWGLGENLAWNYNSWNDAVDAWYNEESLYDYNRAQWSTSIGHFTQIVWKDTKSVGCAYSCRIYVCHYEPPGNVIGYFAQNVGRKKG